MKNGAIRGSAMGCIKDAPVASATEPGIDWDEIASAEHFVQFYERDEVLVQSVASFVGAGLRADHSALLIATAEHREAIKEAVGAAGIDTAAMEEHFHSLDSEELLARFMVGDRPDPARFAETVGSALELASGGGRRRVRAFGEMVAILWADGKRDAAIRLEELWNELLKKHSCSLFCAYPLKGFQGAANGVPFEHVCQAHSRVIPAESYAEGSSKEDRLRTISRLQQKAASLEIEVAERERAEAKLREQQNKLAMAVSIADLGVWELDRNGPLTCSPECCSILAAANHAAVSYDDFLRLLHPDDREEVEGAWERAFDSEQGYEGQFRIIDPAGRQRWIQATARRSGDGTRLLGVMQDITEQKRRADILEHTVAERTAKLQETVADLEAFSYSVSHDMRSPLRAMQGYSTALLEDFHEQLDETALQYLERIQRASTRLDLLVRDVLSYSRVSKGDILPKPVALEPLIEDLIAQNPEFERHKECITVRRPLHTVLGQEAYVGQCIANLLTNAVKFVPRGKTPEVTIQSERTGDRVRVRISDNGIGIQPEHRERVFRMFERVYSENDYPGSGMGLAIVKKAISRLGGETGFLSEPGKGSEFWFCLPAASDEP